jgi:hypothetical protein
VRDRLPDCRGQTGLFADTKGPLAIPRKMEAEDVDGLANMFDMFLHVGGLAILCSAFKDYTQVSDGSRCVPAASMIEGSTESGRKHCEGHRT